MQRFSKSYQLISTFFFPLSFLVHSEHPSSWKKPLKIIWSPLHPPDSLRRKNTFHTATERRQQHFFMQLPKREAQGQAGLVGSFSWSKLERVFAHQGCCHRVTHLSIILQWKQLWTAFEGLSQGKGGKFASFHKANMLYMRMTWQNFQRLFTRPKTDFAVCQSLQLSYLLYFL